MEGRKEDQGHAKRERARDVRGQAEARNATRGRRKGERVDATVHDGEGWQRSGRRDQAAFMSRVLRSRTCTPHDAWPGGRLQRARHGLAARKTGPPPRNAQAARRPPATGGVAQASSLRHPLGGGAKRDTVAGVFSKGAPPPPPPPTPRSGCSAARGGGSITSAPGGAQANPRERQTSRGGGRGCGRVEAADWHAVFRSHKRTGK